MIKRRHWHIRNKIRRHRALTGDRRLLRNLPPTRLLNRKSLKTCLQKYKVIYVKPVYGSFGNKIMKLSRIRNHYVVRNEQKVRTVRANRISSVVFRHTRGRPFMIQKGISLQHVNGYPVDYRLLMLKPANSWLMMGIMGKQASGNRIVTNYNHGGKPIQFRQSLLSLGWTARQINNIQAKMVRIGLIAARQFARRYKHCRRLGIDLAIDTEKRLWIIEVNTNPLYDLFRHHENPTLYRRIDRYMKEIKKRQRDQK
ncbi:YheC/YheD family protein [Paenibacillus tarimensis]